LLRNVEYDIYGNIRKLMRGSLNDCPFRFPGQYADEETGLYYNRFRYYDPGSGGYVSQDPIRLVADTLLIYSYVEDSNFWFDPNGLAKFGSGKGSHTAIVNIFDSGGDRVHREVFKSGNMTPEEKALGFPKSSLATHTEARATKGLPLSKGQKMQIIGQYPPCNSCKGKMNAKANASGADIEYLWKDEKTGKIMKWVACKK
jgi:RHS repeat-associated protein